MSPMSIRIVVADDHPIACEGTVSILGQDPALAVVGVALDGKQALAHCDALRPDVLLLDMSLPLLAGPAVARALAGRPRAPRVVMLSAFEEPALVRAALDAGATGYVLKSTPGVALRAAIHRTMAGERVLLGVAEPDEGPEPLSERELVALRDAAAGKTARETAAALGVSDRTVETYLTRAYQKLRASTKSEAVTIAQRAGILTVG